MEKKLIKIGDSKGIILDKTLLALIGFTEHDIFHVSVKNNKIILQKGVNNEQKRKS